MINGLMVKTTNPKDVSIDIHIDGVCSSGYSVKYGGLESILKAYLTVLSEGFKECGWTEEVYEEYSPGFLPVASLKLVRWEDD